MGESSKRHCKEKKSARDGWYCAQKSPVLRSTVRSHIYIYKKKEEEEEEEKEEKRVMCIM